MTFYQCFRGENLYVFHGDRQNKLLRDRTAAGQLDVLLLQPEFKAIKAKLKIEI